MSLLGINLQRIGQEQEGTDVLEAAFEGDPFNVWTGNTLNLLDSFKRGEFERIQDRRTSKSSCTRRRARRSSRTWSICSRRPTTR